MYLIRLDDASEYMNISNWMRMKTLLVKYGVKPIYGIIPNNRDPELLQYEKVEGFWDIMREWQEKGWIPAMHGFTHVFETLEGGINPINDKSEFAGLSLERQREKIKQGYAKLLSERIKPEIFFAPAHTFDVNTLKALYKETPVRIISDTIANDVYYRKPFYFIPQQSGRVRKLPFKTVTFCYHPNTMQDEDFRELENFLKGHQKKMGSYKELELSSRKRTILDNILRYLYFIKRRSK